MKHLGQVSQSLLGMASGPQPAGPFLYAKCTSFYGLHVPDDAKAARRPLVDCA